jgi:hypothetical protein
MAAVEVTITGMLYDVLNRTTQRVVLIGEGSLTGLGVGGGPIIPPGGGGGGGPVDPGYSPPWAQVRPPVDPGYSPPWAQVRPPVDPGYSPPWAQVPGDRPGAIVPPMPVQPPTTPTEPTPPADNSGWAWHPAFGWGYFPPNQAVPK